MGGDDAGSSVGGDDGGAATVFRHPGILVNDDQLQWLKARISSHQEPWASAFKAVNASPFAASTYAPAAVANVVCGPNSMPDMGCTAEMNDAIAAYTHALLWYLTGDRSHAQTAIAILNAWSATVKQHSNSNAPIQTAWAGALFPRAAEIVRWTNAGWASADETRFEAMLKSVYLPAVINGAPNMNGDWELSMAEATVAIGVFLDDKATFDRGVVLWRARLPAFIYLSSDGAVPVLPPGTTKTSAQILSYWSSPTKLVDGLGQPTCHNVSYTQHGLGALINVAETARIQGVDLYSEQSARITAGLELHAQYANGAPVPSWLCGGTLVAPAPLPTWEIAYNAYVNRLGGSLPMTGALLTAIRPTATDHTTDWETLTHYSVGAVGIR
jgi:hypothetical protein